MTAMDPLVLQIAEAVDRCDVLTANRLVEDLRRSGDEAESLLASTTDLLNSWAREYGVNEAPTEHGIKGVVNRLWDKCALLRLERDHLKANETKASA